MGKKSKRRGGTGGGRKGRSAGTLVYAGDTGGSLRLACDHLAAPALTPAEAVALLETVPPPTSLKGIVSTNEDPGKCAICSSPAAIVVTYPRYGIRGVEFSDLPQLCCGKRFCDACALADDNCGFALDLLGENRCIFCNCKESDRAKKTLLSNEPWAKYSLGLTHRALWKKPDLRVVLNVAFNYMVQAASQGHPEAFLKLSELCRGEWGHPRDLAAARAFAEKARCLHPDLRLESNKALLDTAKGYLHDGAVQEVLVILSYIA